MVDAALSELAGFDMVLTEEAASGPPSQYLAKHRHEYDRTVRDVLRYRPPGGGRPVRVLEIGAFFGTVCLALAKAGYDVTAADIPEYIEMQSARYAGNGIKTSSIRLQDLILPFADESFDVVVMCEVLEHLNFNPLPVLKEINRVLSPDGIFYLSLPNYVRAKNRLMLLRGEAVGIAVHDHFEQLDPAKPTVANGHWREYTRDEVRRMLEPLGFRLAEHYYFSESEVGTGKSLRRRLGRLLYRTIPSLKENQTAIAIRERRTPITFAIPSTVHAELREL